MNDATALTRIDHGVQPWEKRTRAHLRFAKLFGAVGLGGAFAFGLAPLADGYGDLALAIYGFWTAAIALPAAALMGGFAALAYRADRPKF